MHNYGVMPRTTFKEMVMLAIRTVQSENKPVVLPTVIPEGTHGGSLHQGGTGPAESKTGERSDVYRRTVPGAPKRFRVTLSNTVSFTIQARGMLEAELFVCQRFQMRHVNSIKRVRSRCKAGPAY